MGEEIRDYAARFYQAYIVHTATAYQVQDYWRVLIECALACRGDSGPSGRAPGPQARLQGRRHDPLPDEAICLPAHEGRAWE